MGTPDGRRRGGRNAVAGDLPSWAAALLLLSGCVAGAPANLPARRGDAVIGPIDPASLYDTTRFLWNGPNPGQVGVAGDTLSRERVAVLHGE